MLEIYFNPFYMLNINVLVFFTHRSSNLLNTIVVRLFYFDFTISLKKLNVLPRMCLFNISFILVFFFFLALQYPLIETFLGVGGREE